MNTRLTVAILFFFSVVAVRSQYKVDRLIVTGKVAMHYEDYVLSIQYFNQAINQKPYLWEPWQLRAISKYYLEDWVGAEADASKAIELNPYITSLYDLRGISRIHQKKYHDAISDYSRAIELEPGNKGFWYNRAVCYAEVKDYEGATIQYDSIIRKWSDYAPPYLMKAEACLNLKDTVRAMEWVEQCLVVDPNYANAWRLKAYVLMMREQWQESETAWTKSLQYKPKDVGCYINRASVRLHVNNLRGAMSDYDMALDLAPNNFLAHYNRGLLRMRVGDNNRAIEDFDYVLSLEPGNVMALFNRATLLDQTGDLHAAVRDYSIVIKQFPNFWLGLQYRASCYRRLGMTAKAQQDEFKILKAQMDKHLGVQQRWSASKLSAMRKLNDIDIEKYNQLVIEDTQETEHEYKSEYRGKVQNRYVEEHYEPYIALSLATKEKDVSSYTVFDSKVDEFVQNLEDVWKKGLSRWPALGGVGEGTGISTFQMVDSISERIDKETDKKIQCVLFILRSVAYSSAQDYQSAINDLDAALRLEPENTVALWQRSVCSALMAEYEQLSESSKDSKLRNVGIDSMFDVQMEKDPDNALILYNKGTFLARRGEYNKAIAVFNRVIELDSRFPYAYFNRGIAYTKTGETEKAKADFGKAGELGLYKAYSLMKNIKK